MTKWLKENSNIFKAGQTEAVNDHKGSDLYIKSMSEQLKIEYCKNHQPRVSLKTVRPVRAICVEDF